MAGQQFVKRHTKAVDIRVKVVRVVAHDFRCDVVGRADAADLFVFIALACQAEVDQIAFAIGIEQEIGGFDVQVQHPGLERGGETLRGVDCQMQCRGLIQHTIRIDVPLCAAAAQVFHRDVRVVLVFADVIDLDDVAVIQQCEFSRFFDHLARVFVLLLFFRGQDLDRALSVQQRIQCLEHLACCAAPDHLQKNKVTKFRGDAHRLAAAGTLRRRQRLVRRAIDLATAFAAIE